MSDDADITADRAELEESIRRKYAQKPGLELLPTGFCLNCGDKTTAEQRWCDVSCRNDWQGRQR